MQSKLFSRILLLTVTGVSVLLAEPSVYSYRDSAPSYDDGYAAPRGRTPAKVVITQNRDNIVRLKRRIAELEERVDGLASLVEGLSITVNELQAPGRLQAAPTSSPNTCICP